MLVFEIIGITAVTIIAIVLIDKVFRYFVPKKYNWNSCPNDHDTMARCGSKRCDKCGSEL